MSLAVGFTLGVVLMVWANRQWGAPKDELAEPKAFGVGGSEWKMLHVDRALVVCCLAINLPLFSWIADERILWWIGLFAVMLVNAILDRSHVAERTRRVSASSLAEVQRGSSDDKQEEEGDLPLKDSIMGIISSLWTVLSAGLLVCWVLAHLVHVAPPQVVGP